MNVLENTNLTYVVDLEYKGEPLNLFKDQGDTVSFSLLNNKGEVVEGVSDVCYNYEEEVSTLKLFIPKEKNILSEGVESETRTLLISVEKGGMSTYAFRKRYKIIKFVPYSVTEAEVFDLLGVSEDIISTELVDIYNSYLELESTLNGTLKEKLIEGGLNEIKANRAILLNAALSLETTLPLATPQSETDSIVSQKRFVFDFDDFKKLFDTVRQELGELLNDLGDDDQNYTPTIFVVGTVTDPVTGE